MEQLQLATAGDDIKLWDCNNGLSFTLLHAFNPHGNKLVNSLSWNSDGSFLASCSAKDEHVIMTYTKNAPSTTIELPVGVGVECCDFNSSLRYLLCAGSDGVSVWDLKTRVLKKSYKEHKSRVTAARYNWNNSYIAAGSQQGEIILHNTVTGQSSSPLVAPNIQAIRQLEYSVFRKSMFGTASDDGAISLWDANTRRLLHSFSGAHEGPATGIAFSPINEMLMMSVGLDKRVICYDIQKKQVLKVIDAQSPLTCIDTMSDGATAAVGSTRGKVHVYDLRQGGNTPIHIFQAHKSSVHSLRFVPSARLKTDNVNSTKTNSSAIVGNRRQLPLAPASVPESSPVKTGQEVPVISTTPQTYAASPRHSVDVFSPPNEGNQSNHSKSVSHLNITAGSFADVPYTGVFSPLTKGAENLSAVSAYAGDSLLSVPSFLKHNNSSIHNSTTSAEQIPSSPPLQGDSVPYRPTIRTAIASTTDHLSYLHPNEHVHSPMAENLSYPRMCSSLQNSVTENMLGSLVPAIQDIFSPVPVLNGFLNQQLGDFQVQPTRSVSPVSLAMPAVHLIQPSRSVVSPDSAAVSGGEEGGGSSGRMVSEDFRLSGGSSTATTVTNSAHAGSKASVPYISGSKEDGMRSYPAIISSNNNNSNAEQLASKFVAPLSFDHSLVPAHQTKLSTAGNGGMAAASGPVELGAAAGAAQREFLRSLVTDAMEDLQDNLHRDIQSLHVAMLKQFHNFEREVQGSLSHYAEINQKLLLHVRQLEEENKRLKKNY